MARPSRAPALSRLDRLAEWLGAISGFQQPVDQVLSARFRADAGLGPRERQLLAESVYAGVRHWALHASLLRAEGWKPADRTYARRQALMAAGVAVGLDRIVSEITDGERAWLLQAQDRLLAETTPITRYSLPNWIWDDWVQQLGAAEAAACATKMLEPAGLDLRVNLIKASRDSVLAALGEFGVTARASEHLEDAIHVDGKPSLQKMAMFLAGGFEFQDLGSQLLARLAAPKRGAFVVDYCAGAGGKTLALGALMRNTGRLYALDRSAARLSRIKPRLARSGLSNVWPIAISGPTDERIKRLRGKADLVMVDAPCSGLGTLRRNPDLKWRQSPVSVSELVLLQSEILESAARLCAPGGRLLYGTCSTSLLENEDQVARFLLGHPEFTKLNAMECLTRQGIELPAAWAAGADGGALRLWPHRTATDGFYGAMLVKSGL